MTDNEGRPTLTRIDTGKVADVVVRGLAEFRDRNPEGWEDFLALVDVQGGLQYELSLMDDGTVEIHMAGVPIARVAFALVERTTQGEPRRWVQ
jgi:hypothetical protein